MPVSKRFDALRTAGWSLTLTLTVSACGSGVAPGWDQRGVRSPDGQVNAYVGESQLFVAFFDGGCTSGALWTTEPNPDLRLRWRDSATLEVSTPGKLPLFSPLSHKPTRRERYQCGERVVHVVVVDGE